MDEHGVKVLYTAEEAAPTYLAELQEDYKAIQRDEVELSSSEEVVQELRDLWRLAKPPYTASAPRY